MEIALFIGWVAVAIGFCAAIWTTHDMGPASENGPIAAAVWLLLALLTIGVSAGHVAARIWQWSA